MAAPTRFPVVLIHGVFGFGRQRPLWNLWVPYWPERHLRELNPNHLIVGVSGVSSDHDRACEAFYQLYGGRVDYGEEHSAKAGTSRPLWRSRPARAGAAPQLERGQPRAPARPQLRVHHGHRAVSAAVRRLLRRRVQPQMGAQHRQYRRAAHGLDAQLRRRRAGRQGAHGHGDPPARDRHGRVGQAVHALPRAQGRARPAHGALGETVTAAGHGDQRAARHVQGHGHLQQRANPPHAAQRHPQAHGQAVPHEHRHVTAHGPRTCARSYGLPSSFQWLLKWSKGGRALVAAMLLAYLVKRAKQLDVSKLPSMYGLNWLIQRRAKSMPMLVEGFEPDHWMHNDGAVNIRSMLRPWFPTPQEVQADISSHAHPTQPPSLAASSSSASLAAAATTTTSSSMERCQSHISIDGFHKDTDDEQAVDEGGRAQRFDRGRWYVYRVDSNHLAGTYWHGDAPDLYKSLFLMMANEYEREEESVRRQDACGHVHHHPMCATFS